MKYKITAYITSVVMAISICVAALLGFKLMNYKDAIGNSGNDSVLLINVQWDDEHGKSQKDKKIYSDVYGRSLYSIIKDDEYFTVTKTGMVNSINGIDGTKNPYWMMYSTTNVKCINNPIIKNSCEVGSAELILTNVNEVTFKLEHYGYA
ncbi:hypothetical protein [Spiroplasma sp. TIUS-1]|uniref:hypothetical protein n=1 Tax=Spiroplasma sp. TIUS-1 TaxID=216963 RepID=UPI0013A68A5B|nr:hypothetical protein [Spiroplasma sp. TIUS-1]